jgi:cytochrome P450
VLAGERGRYSKGARIFNEIAAARGRGLLTSEGERWQHQRRLIQLFTRRAVAGYATLMAEEASAATARWAPGATVAAKVDAHAEMTRLTLRVVGRAIFGDDVDATRDVMRSAFPSVTSWASGAGCHPRPRRRRGQPQRMSAAAGHSGSCTPWSTD